MSTEGPTSSDWPETSDLPIIQLEDEGFLGADEPRTVLITGASGNIGKKLHRAWREIYDLILIDRQPDPDDPDLIVADLAEWDESWVELFDEADVVIHLAANPNQPAPWEDLIGPNLDALANVFHAASVSGVDRLIFASSNHAMGGYRDRPETPITTALTPLPDSPYGAAKLWGERLGISLARASGLSFVGLRIGWVQPGENRPGTLPDDWSRGLWLSNADAIGLFTRAVEAPMEPGEALIVNGMSRNRGTRWSLAEAQGRLGFVPKDDAWAGVEE